MSNAKTFATISTAFTLTSILTASAGFASGWSQNDDPRYFNTNYNSGNYVRTLGDLPVNGVLDRAHTPWSDSYWPKQRGAFTYRWRKFQDENANQTMTDAERAAAFFNYKTYSLNELRSMTADQINELSPLEKYSIYIRDYSYKLVRKYQSDKQTSPNRVSWEGYCHDWAPAATHYPEPNPSTVTNADGITIHFGSGDIKALLVANYQDYEYHPMPFGFAKATKGIKVYLGQGCDSRTDATAFLFPTKKFRAGHWEMADYDETDGKMDGELESLVQTYQNDLKIVMKDNPNSSTLPSNADKIANDLGFPQEARRRANLPGCTGVNAGVFHLVISNQLGRMHKGFELDKTRDQQIWNQPARGFKSNIVSTMNGALPTSAPGTVSVVTVETSLEYADDTDYGWTYENPTLGGLFGESNPGFDKEYQTYTNMLINQGQYAPDEKKPTYPDNVMDTVHYKYTLDLDANGTIIGGDWLTLNRPDTLWIMKPAGFMGDFSRLGEVTDVRYHQD